MIGKIKKNIIIMAPTVNEATMAWKEFLSRWSQIISKANRPELSITLLTGQKIYFKGKTEGERALRGLCCDIVRLCEVEDIYERETKIEKA